MTIPQTAIFVEDSQYDLQIELNGFLREIYEQEERIIMLRDIKYATTSDGKYSAMVIYDEYAK